MSLEWIKIRKDLPSDPNVALIAKACDISIAQTILALITFWSWADSHSIDGKDMTVSPEFIDDMVRVRLFSASLADTNWLEVSDGTVTIPNFEVHLSKSAKRRALDQKRKSKERQLNQDSASEIGPHSVRTESGQNVDQSKSKSKSKNKEQQHTSRPDIVRTESGQNVSAAAAVVSEEDAGEEAKLSEVVHELRGIGMDTRAIPQLTANHPYPKILEAIAMVKARGDGVKNRAGLVRAALDGDWDTEGGDGGKSAFEEEREADFEKSTRKREQQRKEHAQRHADHLQHLNTLAALPPGEFESIKDAAFEKIPEGMRSSIPEGTDPLEHGVWRSFMWTEYEKRNAGSQSDELIPGVY